MNEKEYNDILYLDKYSKEIGNLIANKVFDTFTRNTKKMVISIGGVSGSKKSEIAIRTHFALLELYNISSAIKKLDNCYKIPPEQREEYRKKTGIIGREEIDKLAVYHEIADFKEGMYLSHIHVLIVEGLFALENCYAADLKIHLNGSIDTTKEFRLLRKKEPQSEFRQKVLRIEERDVIELSKNANFII